MILGEDKGSIMSRCQHCNKLTHSEDLYVRVKNEDLIKVMELQNLLDWIPVWNYGSKPAAISPSEYGKLRCGDIYIHFIIDPKEA